MAADHVVLFSGNGAFCAHHDHMQWERLVQDLDYCGVPWLSHDGIGGDGGSHSYRYRPAMIQVLDYAEAHHLSVKSTEFVFFIDTMMRMNKEDPNQYHFRIASKDQTHDFGGVYNLSSAAGLQRLPIVVSGTQAKMEWNDRNSLLTHCPELKMIFPSMHEPACFGAHPNGAVCKKSICALQDVIPPQGC
jgi:hypothetical protein